VDVGEDTVLQLRALVDALTGCPGTAGVV